MDMQPINPNQPLTVTLSAQEWNTVMAGLNELPHRIARPVFDRIGQQLQQQSQFGGTSHGDEPRPGNRHLDGHLSCRLSAAET